MAEIITGTLGNSLGTLLAMLVVVVISGIALVAVQAVQGQREVWVKLVVLALLVLAILIFLLLAVRLTRRILDAAAREEEQQAPNPAVFSVEDRVSGAVSDFMADLYARDVLRRPVDYEDEVRASKSITEIRDAAKTLMASVVAAEDKGAAGVIMKASRVAMDTFDNRSRIDVGRGHRYDDCLNAYRDAVREPVEDMCKRHGLPREAWPEIPVFRGGPPDEPVEIYIPRH